jgi:hypothetical protein
VLWRGLGGARLTQTGPTMHDDSDPDLGKLEW